MRKRIGLLLSLAFLLPVVGAQPQVRNKGGAHRTDVAQRKAEEAQRRAQAVDILKGVVEGAADIQELRTRVNILTGALDLLWKHDEAYARANFVKSAGAWSDRFTSDVTERSEIRASMGILLSAFARHAHRRPNDCLISSRNRWKTCSMDTWFRQASDCR